MEIDIAKIEDAIVRDAVQKIVSDDDVYSRVGRGVDERINALFAAKANAQIDEAIAKAIRDGFERSYQAVDQYGRPVGTKTTIAEQLSKLIGDYWNQKVDGQGKPTSSDYTTTTTRAVWLMSKMCADDFSGQMKQHVVNVAGGLKDGLRAELRKTVDGLLSELFHVRSAGDEELKRQDRSIIHPPVKPAA